MDQSDKSGDGIAMFNNVKMPINADAIDRRRQTSSLGFKIQR